MPVYREAHQIGVVKTMSAVVERVLGWLKFLYLEKVKLRQWVITFPYQLRHWLARSPKLFAEVIRVVTDEISISQKQSTEYEQSSIPFDEREHALVPSSGAITFIQRFSSNLSCNPHLHMIFLDGAYARTHAYPKSVPYLTGLALRHATVAL